MAFPVVPYKNNRLFDDIQNPLLSLISDTKAMDYWIKIRKDFYGSVAHTPQRHCVTFSIAANRMVHRT